MDSGHTGDYSRFEPGDFSTSCYPFDQGPAYIGNSLDHRRIATSLKPVFLLLCGLDKSELELYVSEYPHSRELLSRISCDNRNRKTFVRKLSTAVQYFFRFLRKQTMETCRTHGLRVTSVGISVPGQWPGAVEDYLADVFLQNFCGRGEGHEHFRVGRDNIFFHSETQALAHFFFKHHGDDPRVTKSRDGVFLLADFGGQNLVRGIVLPSILLPRADRRYLTILRGQNISTYQVGPGLDGRMTFFEMGFSAGVLSVLPPGSLK